MKSKSAIFSCFAVAVSLAATASAQLPVSQPVVAIRTPLTTSLRLISLPFTEQPAARGVINTTLGSTITLSSVSGLNSLTGPHTVQFVTGENYGRYFTVSSFPSSNQVTVVGSLPGGIVNDSDEVIIYPNFTLNSLFPNGGAFKTGGNSAAADRVFTAVSGAIRSFYYNSTNNRWQFADAPSTVDQGGVVFDFNAGLLVRGASTTPGAVALSGVSRSGTVRQAYNSTALRVVSLSNTAPITLDNSPFDGAVLGGANAAASDRVFLVVGGALRSFFFNTTVGQWRFADSSSTVNQGSVSIPAGSAALLRPANTAARFINFQEQFATN